MLIKREVLTALLPLTQRTGTRPYLQAIQANPATQQCVATNGHVLLVAKDTAPHADAEFPLVTGVSRVGDPDVTCIPAATVQAMLAAIPKRPTLQILGACQLSKVEGGTVTIAATDLRGARVEPIPSSEGLLYPDWQKIMLRAGQPAAVTVILAVDVLETLIKAAKAIGPKRYPSIQFSIPTGAADREVTTNAEGKKVPGDTVISGVGITILGPDTGVEITGVAMPMRA